jgi:hypothetical protein
MHDPMTLAFEIRAPWKRGGYRPTLLAVWHVDPERGGDDDSCGWSYVKAPKLRDQARKLGEAEQVFITGRHGYAMTPFELVFEVWQTIAARMFKRSRWRGRGLSHRELVYVLNLANNPGDNLRYSCKAADTPKGMGDLFCAVLRCYLTFHRKWWQHPRWHVHHWRIQVPAVQAFKRWAFTRCATCAGRFRFGEAPTTNTWHGTGPRWFRGEADMHHGNCASVACAKEAA